MKNTITMSKQCSICKTTKTNECFSVNRQRKDGLDSRCKICMREYKRTRRGNVSKTYPILDFDFESDEWQIGKVAGSISVKTTVVTVEIKHQTNRYSRSFSIKKYTLDGAIDRAKAWQLEKSNELGLTKNRIRMHPEFEDAIEVQLTKGKTMIADVDHLDICQKYSLCVTKGGKETAEYYCTTSVNGVMKNFHNLITEWDMVDHINRNPLDNRLCNLRQTTPKENNNNRKINPRKNTSGVVGVRRVNDRPGGAWMARIKQDNKEHTISFSINEYGDEMAKLMAIAARMGMNKMCNSTNGQDPETGEMQQI